MKIEFKKGDIFTEENNRNDTVYIHCVSADFVMGKGIAKDMNKYFDCKFRCKSLCKNDKTIEDTMKRGAVGTFPVINLITKKRFSDKPTYSTLEYSLTKMIELIKLKHNIKVIASPKIACGLDGLDWKRVKPALIDLINKSGWNGTLIIYE